MGIGLLSRIALSASVAALVVAACAVGGKPNPNPYFPAPNPTVAPDNPVPAPPGDYASLLAGVWYASVDRGACGTAAAAVYFGSDGGWAMDLQFGFIPGSQSKCADVSFTGTFVADASTIQVQIDPSPYCQLEGMCDLPAQSLTYSFEAPNVAQFCDLDCVRYQR